MWGNINGIKDKGEKDKRIKIRQQFCCLIEYGELFELCPERCIFLLFLCFFGGLGVVFDEIIVRLLRR